MNERLSEWSNERVLSPSFAICFYCNLVKFSFVFGQQLEEAAQLLHLSLVCVAVVVVAVVVVDCPFNC